MIDVYAAATYRDVVDCSLRIESGTNRRGVAQLAEALKVHPTFVAKVIKGSVDFSMEHAIRFCRHVPLDDVATDYFVDLVNRDRAADDLTRRHFNGRLDAARAKKENLKERLRGGHDLSLEQQLDYYESWLPQAIHIRCQTKGRHDRASLTKALGVSETSVREVVTRLLEMQILVEKDKQLHSNIDFVHTGRESALIRRLHINWRQKIISDVMEGRGLAGVHFSAVASMSAAAESKIRMLITESLEQSKKVIANSESEKVCVYAVDFYEI